MNSPVTGKHLNRGRPMKEEKRWYIGVDIGGTQLRAALFGESGLEPLNLKKAATHSPKAEPLEILKELIAQVWPAEGTVARIGVGVAGPLNPATGIVYRCPNIPEWQNLALAQLLQERFQTPVAIGNDANLAALAEWKYGAGVGHNDLLYLTISTGIGGGVISEGRLLTGARGIAAELGHFTVWPDGPLCGCGHRGHLEAISSGTAITNYVREQLVAGRASSLSACPDELNASLISSAAREGDPLAAEAFERAGTFLGRALADFLHLYDPTILVLGGGVMKSGELIMRPVRREMEAGVMSPEYLRGLTVTTAKLGDRVGLIGALALAQS